MKSDFGDLFCFRKFIVKKLEMIIRIKEFTAENSYPKIFVKGRVISSRLKSIKMNAAI